MIYDKYTVYINRDCLPYNRPHMIYIICNNMMQDDGVNPVCHYQRRGGSVIGETRLGCWPRVDIYNKIYTRANNKHKWQPILCIMSNLIHVTVVKNYQIILINDSINDKSYNYKSCNKLISNVIFGILINTRPARCILSYLKYQAMAGVKYDCLYDINDMHYTKLSREFCCCCSVALNLDRW